MKGFASTNDSVQMSAFNSTQGFYDAQFRSQTYDDSFEQQQPPPYVQQQQAQLQHTPPQPIRRQIGPQMPQALAGDRAMGSITRTSSDDATAEELKRQIEKLPKKFKAAGLSLTI